MPAMREARGHSAEKCYANDRTIEQQTNNNAQSRGGGGGEDRGSNISFVKQDSTAICSSILFTELARIAFVCRLAWVGPARWGPGGLQAMRYKLPKTCPAVN